MTKVLEVFLVQAVVLMEQMAPQVILELMVHKDHLVHKDHKA